MGIAAEVGRNPELKSIIAARDLGLPAAARTAAEEILQACAQRAAASGDDPVVIALMELAASASGKNDRYQAALIAAVGAQSFPGATPFGALMALGDALSEDARLIAFAIGCEVNVRLAAALAPQSDFGWEVGGIAGAIGSSVTAALLLEAEEKTLTRAVGIASSMTLGQRVARGTTSARLVAGKASSNGVLAALLAQRGFTGPPSLESARGLCTVLGAVGLSDVLVDFGKSWAFA